LEKLSTFQKKLLELIKNAEILGETYKKKNINVFFDFYCTNDDCSGRNGHRVQATAWKSNSGDYKIFCQTCGQEDSLTKEQFKDVKQMLSKEEAYANMEKMRDVNKKIIGNNDPS